MSHFSLNEIKQTQEDEGKRFKKDIYTNLTSPNLSSFAKFSDDSIPSETHFTAMISSFGHLHIAFSYKYRLFFASSEFPRKDDTHVSFQQVVLPNALNVSTLTFLFDIQQNRQFLLVGTHEGTLAAVRLGIKPHLCMLKALLDEPILQMHSPHEQPLGGPPILLIRHAKTVVMMDQQRMCEELEKPSPPGQSMAMRRLTCQASGPLFFEADRLIAIGGTNNTITRLAVPPKGLLRRVHHMRVGPVSYIPLLPSASSRLALWTGRLPPIPFVCMPSPDGLVALRADTLLPAGHVRCGQCSSMAVGRSRRAGYHRLLHCLHGKLLISYRLPDMTRVCSIEAPADSFLSGTVGRCLLVQCVLHDDRLILSLGEVRAD
eukprot:gnl/Dysnectes_brevis/4164_a5493_806.p1 GENE.gnl/Dysnectes_brevis/4164_a5493_806~~gnl/Dysnectes_brevis/4164_a5493_806.p1  ORF type:complete len:394 (-),score=24.24 gnl/Dysnectes_brevis/4164_a5493_806:156-1277(-)